MSEDGLGEEYPRVYTLPMQKIVTIAERKARALKRRQDAVAAVVEELRAYASAKGGRFLIFGSVATGHMRADSDLDIVIDFPSHIERDAWRHVEDISHDHGVPTDIHSVSTSSAPFLARIGPHAIVLG